MDRSEREGSFDYQPTLGEVWRTVLATRREVEKLSTKMDQDWLTKEVYDVRHRGLEGRVLVIEHRLSKFESRRFAIGIALLGVAGTAIGSLVVSLLLIHTGTH